MTRTVQLRNAALSYLRVFAAAALACWLERGATPLTELSWADAETVLNAGGAAALLTAFNALRPGETSFGKGAS